MSYFLAFLEGITVFVSPCILPMLPLYLSYFSAEEAGRGRTLRNALGFVLGFTLLFVTLGGFAGGLGGLLIRYSRWVNVVTGCIVILFGLHYLDILRIPFLHRTRKLEMDSSRLKSLNLPSAVLFGAVFAIGWTPCVGPFLGSALLMAASSSQSMAGIWMLLCFSMGLGIPFLVSALLIEQLKSTFDWIKRHYRLVNIVSGCLLIVTGIAMITGWMNRLLTFLSY